MHSRHFVKAVASDLPSTDILTCDSGFRVAPTHSLRPPTAWGVDTGDPPALGRGPGPVELGPRPLTAFPVRPLPPISIWGWE